jgi:ABC-type amino acid transport substrate-binding protein
MLVAVLVVAIIAGSIVYDSGLLQELSHQEDHLRGLKERAATLQQEVSNARIAVHQNDLDAATPHHLAEFVDAQVIGSHANVSWTYPGDDNGKHVGYELQLLRLDPPGTNCDSQTDFFNCKEGMAGRRFIASDVQGHSSRIPPTFEGTLTSGRYAWRVAAIPTGSAIVDSSTQDAQNSSTQDTQNSSSQDAQTRLSAWSAFASFTLYQSQLKRILTTRHVRVGTNLEQSTPFSRRDPNGYVAGFDIALIYTLVQNCLSVRADSIYFDDYRCRQALNTVRSSGKAQAVAQPAACAIEQQTLCVTLVPVHKWGDWKSAMKRKEIDVFVGGITRAVERQRGGISFTKGYLRYDTKLYAHSSDSQTPPTLAVWLARQRRIGVIQDSTNEQLLSDLKASLPRSKMRNVVSVVVPSFPALESAMDVGDVDGVLIDSTFVNEPGWVPVRGITDTLRDRYLTRYIGGDRHEEIAIAVASDDSTSSAQKTGTLLNALQSALSSAIVEHYMPILCDAYWSPSYSDFSCRSGIIGGQ